MRLYGKKVAKRFVDNRVTKRTETRDAILWDIDWSTFTARVKIQGSNTLIYAHFPRNWKHRPYWLRIGNAVRILHREGVRGYVEIVGEGRAIPTPVEGSSLPPSPGLSDMILTGLQVSQTEPPTLGVNVTEGTYRIAGVIYYYYPALGDYIIMNDPPPMVMQATNPEIMGSGIATIALDPVPSPGYYRYDLLVVGTDSQLDYIVGTPSQTNPQKPTIPINHLQVGNYILVRWNATEITNADIGAEWTSQYPTILAFQVTAISPATLDSSTEPFGFNYVVSGEAQVNVKVNIYDQYGRLLSGTYDLDLEMVNSATGDVWSLDDGYDNPLVSQHISWQNNYTFKYRRNEGVSEVSPILKSTLHQTGKSDIVNTVFIQLNDVNDYPIPP